MRLLVVLLLAGCSAVEELPNGQHAITRCVSVTACYERAAKICPKGYDTLKEETQMYGPAPRYMMIVLCH